MGDCFYCSKAEPVVQTKAGKIRGFKMNSTYTFHGIKYADADRFQMPREVKPWKGIKNALAYGYVCPMLMQDHPLMEVMIPHRYWPWYGCTEVDSLQAHPLNRWRMKEII